MALLARSTAALLAVLGATRPEQERRLVARADSNVVIPEPISITPSQYWEGNDGKWSTFPLQLGGGKNTVQNVRVLLSTAAYNTFTIGANGCPDNFVSDCADKRGGLFLPNQSLTWVANSIYGTSIEANLGAATTSNVGFDTVGLGWQGSGGPKLDHSVVFNVFDQKYWLGLFGVNPLPTNFTNLNDPQTSFMQTLYNNGTIPSVSYGYTAGNQYRLNAVYGSLTLGGFDSNRFTGGISWSMGADISRDLLVNIKSISSDNTNLLPGGQISAYVDSTIPSMWLPQSACAAFEKAFGLTYNTTYGYYLLDEATHENLVTQNPSVSITLTNGTQDVSISLPYAAFDLNLTAPIVSDTHYYFPLQRAANESQFTLGRVFLQEAYLIADYSRQNFTIAPCTWDQSKVSNTALHGILSPSLTAAVNSQSGQPASHIGAGAIAGIAIGAVLLLAIAVGLVIYLRRRKTRKDERRRAELDEKTDGTYYSKVAGEHAIEAPDGAVNELDAPYKMKAHEMDSPYKVDPNRHGYFEMTGSQADLGAGKGGAHEMDGQRPVYEMQGSEVPEMPGRDRPLQRLQKSRSKS